LGVAAGPRGTLEITPRPWLGLLASYGEGYRSPQARQLEEGENAPYAKVRSFEVGVRIRPEEGRRLTLTAAGYATTLSYDLAFDPTEGALAKIGPTTRKGGVLQILARPWSWALASLSVTYVRATLDQPPPATAENPSPPFRPGELLPNVPPVVGRADVALTRRLGGVAGGSVEGRIGAGYTFLSARPLPYGQFGDPVSLLDLSLGARWRWLDIGLEAWNVANVRYAGTAFSFVSDWGKREVPSLLPARHFSAGAPRAYLGTLGVLF
jgi:iron complex outermembrane receptor protein